MIRAMLRIRARPGLEQAVEAAWRTVEDQIGEQAGNLLHRLLRDAIDPRSYVVVTEWAGRARAATPTRAGRSRGVLPSRSAR